MGLINIDVKRRNISEWCHGFHIYKPYRVNRTNMNSYMYCAVDGTWVIVSYRTVVMSIDAAGNIHRHWAGWSSTTQNHINVYLGWLAHRSWSKVEHITPKEWGAMQCEDHVTLDPNSDYKY